ncbi:MAG: hypothetical protein LJE66_05450 [Desulfobacterales bacterium]|jgi:hypothetical protein|nr:hypothetical protein [Desulfobacterales bacterium]
MKTMKVLLYSLAIVVIALTSFQSIAAAAQVTRINQNKGFIFIDGTIAEGFVMGANVCFYTSSGEKITCGRIEQASENFARVKISNRIAYKIHYGMTAELPVKNDSKEKATAPLPCTTDSDCGDAGFCFEGRCRQR